MIGDTMTLPAAQPMQSSRPSPRETPPASGDGRVDETFARTLESTDDEFVESGFVEPGATESGQTADLTESENTNAEGVKGGGIDGQAVDVEDVERRERRHDAATGEEQLATTPQPVPSRNVDEPSEGTESEVSEVGSSEIANTTSRVNGEVTGQRRRVGDVDATGSGLHTTLDDVDAVAGTQEVTSAGAGSTASAGETGTGSTPMVPSGFDATKSAQPSKQTQPVQPVPARPGDAAGAGRAENLGALTKAHSVVDVAGSPSADTDSGSVSDATAMAPVVQSSSPSPTRSAPSGPTSPMPSTPPSASQQTAGLDVTRLGEGIGVRLRSGERSQSITLQLHPAELGSVKVDAKLIDGVTHLVITTATSTGGERVAAALHDLRQQLSRHGVDVGDLQLNQGNGGASNGQARGDSNGAFSPEGSVELAALHERTSLERPSLSSLGRAVTPSSGLRLDL